MALLTVDEFKARTLMAPALVEQLEQRRPGHLLTILEDEEAWLHARLRKRYAVPTTAPHPRVLLRWLTQLVTMRAFLSLGFTPESMQDGLIKAEYDLARDEVKEAADSHEGLFDLPVRQDSTATGITYGGPLAYSEASPYTWVDKQAEAVRHE